MRLSIEKQKEYLSKNLLLEDLRVSDDNREMIKEFIQATKGDTIADYLINHAWDDDEERNTKVFLIRDTAKNEIAFYFAINCGILYSDEISFQVTKEEKECLDRYVDACLIAKESGNSDDVTNIELNDALIALSRVADSEARRQALFSMADEKVEYKEERKYYDENDEEKEHTQQVYKTFPAIDIKFLGRNGNYKPSIELSFKLGVYIFWEMIVPHLLDIAKLVGCKYIYLFAADNSEVETTTYHPAPIYDPFYDPYDDDEDQDDKVEIRKLVNYYISELKFHNVTQYKVLKPHYERSCFTLVQEVSELQKNRESVWASHFDD